MLSDDDKKVWNCVAASCSPLGTGSLPLSKLEPYYHNTIIDLHDYTLQQSYYVVCDFIKSSYEYSVKNITIITGKGHPENSIKRELTLWLETDKLKKYVRSYKPMNDGAFIVVLNN